MPFICLGFLLNSYSLVLFHLLFAAYYLILSVALAYNKKIDEDHESMGYDNEDSRQIAWLLR